MKGIRAFAFLLLAAVVCLAGCNQDKITEQGILVIELDSDISRGIESISMETASYNVTVKNSSEAVVFSSAGKTQTSYSISVLAGTYSVYVEALNADGDVIGSGSETCEVEAGRTNSVSITVREPYGQGTFSISITTAISPQIALYFYNADDSLYRRETPPYINGKYESSFYIHTGFYYFTVVREDTGKILHRDTVRIVKDKTASYSASFQFKADGTIVIVNEITSTPTISISLSSATLQAGDTLSASAAISGIAGDYTCYWTVDGEAVTEEGPYADLEYVIPASEEDDHEVALFVKSGAIVWSSSESFVIGGEYFRIGFIDPDFDPDTTEWYLVKKDGDSFEIRMNDDDSASIYYPTVLDTYYRSKYGSFPNSGNPFHHYSSDQLGMDTAEFISALVSKSVTLPYPDYEPQVSHPYVITDESNIPADLTITSIQSLYNGYKGYFRDYETDSVYEFPETNQTYIGIQEFASGSHSYCLLVPEEVIRYYDEKYSETLSYYEKFALYFDEMYGIDVLDNSGNICFTRDQIMTVLSEYRSPNSVKIRIIVQPIGQDFAESLEGTRGYVDIGSELFGWGPLNNTEGWDYIYYEDFEDGDVLTISPWQGYQDDEDVIHRCDVPTCKIVSLRQQITIRSDKVNTIYLQVKSLEGSDEFSLDYDTDFYVTDYPYTIPQGEAGEKYVIDVAEANGVSYDCYGSNLPVYTTTGLHRNNFIPIPAQTSNHFVMYIGEITDEMRFRISVYDESNGVNGYGTFRIRPATSEELAYITETEVTGRPFEIILDLEEYASYIRRFVLSGAEEITSVALFYSTDGENYSEYDNDTVGFHIGFRSGDIDGTSTGYNCTCDGDSVLTSSYSIEVVEIDGSSMINGKLKIVLN